MAVEKERRAIRDNRMDLTDYVIHFTKRSGDPLILLPRGVLFTILRENRIRPTFAPMAHRFSKGVEKSTIKGPDPAVCLTETPNCQ